MHAEVSFTHKQYLLVQSAKNFFGENNALFYIIVIYYHFNIPTVGPFRCADTHMPGRLDMQMTLLY